VLTTYRYRTSATVPCVLGWKVEGPDVDCEVDIAAILDDGGLPVAVVGEAKHYRESIDANDLANLGRIQRHFRQRGIECLVLAAVMRDNIRQEEADALRAFAQRPLNTLPTRSAVEPVLPIVLTGKDLSVPESDQHPIRWASGYGVMRLAQESCRRNLGLATVDNAFDENGHYFHPSWSGFVPEP
jgi:hypothetical protein